MVDVSAVNSNAVQRMIRKFGFSVDIAIRTDDSALLASVYDDALKLPSVQTTNNLLTRITYRQIVFC